MGSSISSSLAQTDTGSVRIPERRLQSCLAWSMAISAAFIPFTLLWDYSWESSIGIDSPSSPPHVANILSVALTAILACVMISRGSAAAVPGLQLAGRRASLGLWVSVWGAALFGLAWFLDRWWQAGYGLAAGIWHPPQLLKAIGFLAVTIGVWLELCPRQRPSSQEAPFAVAGGAVLALVSMFAIRWLYPNRQHTAGFFQLGCATCPLFLVAQARAGSSRWSATQAALAYLFLWGAAVWVLPLFPATPQVAPIFNWRDRLLPPPFPLLLLIPSVCLDLLQRGRPQRHCFDWMSPVEAGLAFFLAFVATQWFFADFLLSPWADDRFFAGGGRHWPFFLEIDPGSRTAFWISPEEKLTVFGAAIALILAATSSLLGWIAGGWMKATPV